MANELDGNELQELIAEAAEVASFSGVKLMESINMSWKSLSAWKIGTRFPKPENLLAMAQVLIVRGQKMVQTGERLARVARRLIQERARERVFVTDEETLSLFDPNGTQQEDSR